MDNWIFGCDVCQDVCPWNRFSHQHTEEQFEPKFDLLGFTRKDWDELNEETFTKYFGGSPLSRTKYEGLKRNIRFMNLE